jgi:hypothetical protein
VSGESRFDVQVRVDGKPTFRVLKAKTLEEALVEMQAVQTSTVPTVDDIVDDAVHDELVAIVREAVRTELQAWAGSRTVDVAAPVAEYEDVPPDPELQDRLDPLERHLEVALAPVLPEPELEEPHDEAYVAETGWAYSPPTEEAPPALPFGELSPQEQAAREEGKRRIQEAFAKAQQK